MKKIVLITALSLICTIGTWAQKFNPSDYADRDGFTHIYISKAMMQMFKDADLAGINLSQIINKLEGIHIVQAEGDEASKTLKKDAAFFNEKNGYEVVLNINEKNEKVKILSSDTKQMKMEFVLTNEEKESFCVIILKGTITPMDALKILENR